ncbi:serine phosphatase RsbU (regulator of sigma subunit)/PAS domain-containing protein/anti-sigma regulatory factor (Ser/Thr protein kinase) [Streptomyces zagrosensis]|uniref:Serine phosphatase RsbU (Regulator of sigma subunit)/PAS domain-containing protein/anti-sigma regulatory factor (Ser/Thr protein kinase) n=1 Tax=Streptomyces zagrosensis TaxID=1042984 RepID=A0A7W9QBV8_9ACTN|nr:serine phosphatase RsbU (regulator of sigma subunit)/PAS domain-containing protein/anti-sigma regulatory factor (Ser/Thr protein kinase) [Streptomyces zagrosensis]
MRSIAGQIFVLQLLIVLLVVATGVTALVLQTRRDDEREARHRALAVAESFAHAPGILDALRSSDPTAVLQPRAEGARVGADVDFVVVMRTDGTRYTHPRPNRIGKKFVGEIGPARRGERSTETVQGTIGRVVQSVVPVTDADGRVVGLVAAGLRTSRVSKSLNDELPILLGGGAAGLALAWGGSALASRRLRRLTHGLDPAKMTRMYEHHDAVLHAVREGVLIVSGDRRLLLANDEARRLLALPDDAEGRHVADLGLDVPLTEVLVSGRVTTDEVVSSGDRLLAVNHRSTERHGGPPGTVATLRDTTELHTVTGRAETASKRLRLLYDAGMEIGTTLDVRRTAEELAQVTVDRLADFTSVDLAETVVLGEEPPAGGAIQMRRTALTGIRDDHPLYPVDEIIDFAASTPQVQGVDDRRAVLAARLCEVQGWRAQDPERAQRILDYGVHSLIAVPLRARGGILGVVNFWRSVKPEPFDEDDVALAEELVAHAAVCLDNARRYTREHAMAVTLQQSLLPRGLPDQSALDVAYRYLLARAGVGGDWFDVIPLPGARVALVVGDVVGHGLHAAATMGRLRTAVHNFSSLDLPPDELLSYLDELVSSIDQDETTASEAATVTGATCLYAIYDPVERRCVVARAGHPPPVIAHPDGSVEVLDLPAGLPLGVTGLPFEAAEIQVPEGSRLVLYTDGLINDGVRDVDAGLELLTEALRGPDRTPEETCQVILDALLHDRPDDDVALLVARTRSVPPDRIADWEVPADPAAVADVRGKVTRTLSAWGLDEEAFTTELILSELITNAIRYTSGPIRVRLIRDNGLICEVADSSSTAPHLRYAATTDEGGRGLFLVAQFAERWGTRYTPTGKVIWTEQAVPGSAVREDA